MEITKKFKDLDIQEVICKINHKFCTVCRSEMKLKQICDTDHVTHLDLINSIEACSNKSTCRHWSPVMNTSVSRVSINVLHVKSELSESVRCQIVILSKDELSQHHISAWLKDWGSAWYSKGRDTPSWRLAVGQWCACPWQYVKSEVDTSGRQTTLTGCSA